MLEKEVKDKQDVLREKMDVCLLDMMLFAESYDMLGEIEEILDLYSEVLGNMGVDPFDSPLISSEYHRIPEETYKVEENIIYLAAN